MPDLTFETMLSGQLREYAEAGVRPIDRFAIAEETIASGRAMPRWRRGRGLAPMRGDRVLTPLLVGLLLAVLAGGALLVGSRLLVPQPRPQGDVHAFVSAPDLSRPMSGPLLAPLVDGRVLVIGRGSDSEDPTPTGLIYDPATGESLPVEALTDVRLAPLVRLVDGRVLIVGDGSASVFDPTTLRIEPAGPMAAARNWPAAAVLRDGRVLIVGGGGANGEHRTAELFDPDTLTFSPTGSVTQQPTDPARRGEGGVVREAIATLPDGRVFVLVSRPTGAAGWRLEAEVYDPSAGTFSTAGTMPDFGVVAAIVIPDGRVLVVGSSGLSSSRVEHAAAWDPTTRTFSPAADPPGTVRYATLLDDGRILLTGGRDLDATSSWAGIYDLAMGMTIPVDPPSASGARLVRLDDGRVLAVGGLVDGHGRMGPDGVTYDAPSVPTVEILQ